MICILCGGARGGGGGGGEVEVGGACGRHGGTCGRYGGRTYLRFLIPVRRVRDRAGRVRQLLASSLGLRSYLRPCTSTPLHTPPLFFFLFSRSLTASTIPLPASQITDYQISTCSNPPSLPSPPIPECATALDALLSHASYDGICDVTHGRHADNPIMPCRWTATCTCIQH